MNSLSEEKRSAGLSAPSSPFPSNSFAPGFIRSVGVPSVTLFFIRRSFLQGLAFSLSARHTAAERVASLYPHSFAPLHRGPNSLLLRQLPPRSFPLWRGVVFRSPGDGLSAGEFGVVDFVAP